MPTYTLYDITYKNTPIEVASFDAEKLKQALSKRWHDHQFSVRATGDTNVSVRVHLNGDRDMLPMMTMFAEGFMASAHLWER